MKNHQRTNFAPLDGENFLIHAAQPGKEERSLEREATHEPLYRHVGAIINRDSTGEVGTPCWASKYTT